MESATVSKCPYVVHTRERERVDWGEEHRYVNRTHLHLGYERLYEDEAAMIGFMDMDETMETHFLLSFYHPMEVQAEWGDSYPQPIMYGQEADDPLLREELRNRSWEVSKHQRWMSHMQLSLLRDRNIRDKLTERRFQSGFMNPTAWINLALRYQSGGWTPGTSREVLREVLLGSARYFNLSRLPVSVP